MKIHRPDGVLTSLQQSACNHGWCNLVETSSNFKINVVFYEYLHNEYRRSFVELHYKLCDLVLKDELLGPLIRKTGINVCPIPPGRYHMMNITFNREFPSMWPFEKGQGELIVNAEPSGKEVARGDLVLTFQMKTKF